MQCPDFKYLKATGGHQQVSRRGATLYFLCGNNYYIIQKYLAAIK